MVKKICISVLALAFCLAASLFIVTSVGYDPWCDLDDDGDVDPDDFAMFAGSYGTSGEPITKAFIEYDSDWIDITDKAGQYFNVTHNLNSTDILIDITGKTRVDGGEHQKHLGGTGYVLKRGRTYGGRNSEYAYSAVQTGDGGYALSGITYSFGAGGDDIYLVKTDPAGTMQWNKTYGGVAGDYSKSIIQTGDGGYAITGSTGSYGAGNHTVWLVKTDSAGNTQWNQTYGGTCHDHGESMIETSDGGYAIAGYTESYGAGSYDFYLVKTNSTGHMEWNKTYGGISLDRPLSVIQTGDGGYATAGYTQSYGAGGTDFWLVKTDSAGSPEWNRTYGGAQYDYAYSLVQTSDGGYALAGVTDSYGAGSSDFWLVKTDSAGNVQWNQTYGGLDSEYAQAIVETPDGGYAIAGYTNSFGVGSVDAWLVKTNSTGDIKWNQTYGGTYYDYGYSMVQTSDGGYAIAGETASFGAGARDCWLVKTDSHGNAEWLADWFRYGLAWTHSTSDTITLYRGGNDAYWNYVRVRIWKIKETP